MSKTNIFQSRDTMPDSTDGVVRTHMTLPEAAQYGGQPLPGMRKNPNDVVNTHTGMPNPTGRRP